MRKNEKERKKERKKEIKRKIQREKERKKTRPYARHISHLVGRKSLKTLARLPTIRQTHPHIESLRRDYKKKGVSENSRRFSSYIAIDGNKTFFHILRCVLASL